MNGLSKTELYSLQPIESIGVKMNSFSNLSYIDRRQLFFYLIASRGNLTSNLHIISRCEEV